MLGGGTVYIPRDDGAGVVDENFARLAEIIENYDPNLELRWIPPEHRDEKDVAPWMVVECRNGAEYPVLRAGPYVTAEEILAKVFNSDNANSNVLDELEAHNRAIEAFEQKRLLEKLEEAHDEAKFLKHTHLNTVRMNGKIFNEDKKVVGRYDRK